MTEATMPVTVEQDHERIYLQPKCCAEHAYDGRQWCEDPVWDCECDEDYRKPIVEYVRADLALNTRAPPPPPAGLATRFAKLADDVVKCDQFSAWRSVYLENLGKFAAEHSDSILTALTANGSQPDRVVDVLPAALAEQACLIGKSGTTVTIECDDYDEALAVFDWITLLSTLDAKDQSNG